MKFLWWNFQPDTNAHTHISVYISMNTEGYSYVYVCGRKLHAKERKHFNVSNFNQFGVTQRGRSLKNRQKKMIKNRVFIFWECIEKYLREICECDKRRFEIKCQRLHMRSRLAAINADELAICLQ